MLTRSHCHLDDSSLRSRVAVWDNRATQHFAIDDRGGLLRLVLRSKVHGQAAVALDGCRSITRCRPEASNDGQLDVVISQTARALAHDVLPRSRLLRNCPAARALLAQCSVKKFGGVTLNVATLSGADRLLLTCGP